MEINVKVLEDALRKELHHGLGIFQQNERRLKINNQFLYPSEQPYNIILKKDGDRWFITDEGATINVLENYALDSDFIKNKIHNVVVSRGLTIYKNEILIQVQSLDKLIVYFSDYIKTMHDLLETMKIYI